MQVTMTVNDQEYTRDVEPRMLLIHFLRDELGLTGSHWGCDTSNCGMCVVWLDAVQEGFMACHGLQCGFCTPGMMMTARWLLDHNPDPSEQEIREAISGQVCRCTGYVNIVRAIRWAAEHPAALPASSANSDSAASSASEEVSA